MKVLKSILDPLTHSFIHSFTLILEYSIPRIDQNSLLSKVYILIGKVDSQLIITE